MNKYQHISIILDAFKKSKAKSFNMPGKFFIMKNSDADIEGYYHPDDFIIVYKEMFDEDLIFEYNPMFDYYKFSVLSDKDA